LEPALIVLLAALLLRETIGISAVMAVVIGLAGVALIMDSGGAASAICCSPPACSPRACTASSPSALTTTLTRSL
jgi:drug/metabolite transporter (DMT)-like permease